MKQVLAALALALMMAVSPSVPQDQPKARSEGLELLVLGSGGPRSFGRAATSYLVLVGGVPRILVDAGPGAYQAVGKLGVDLSRVDLVLLTHLHIDHSSDLPALFLHRSLTAAGPIRFRVFGPKGGGLFPDTSRFVRELFGPGGAWEYQRTFGADEQIDAVDLATGLDSPAREIVSDGELRVREIATHHGDCPSVAYRIDYRGESIAFSGDMDASALANLESLAKGSDLLVFHCAVLDPPGSPEFLYTLHTPPRKIGEATRAAAVKQLVLSHFAPDVERREDEVRRSVEASYPGTVKFAHDGLRVAVRGAR
ncbi:MAG TPA: MBL fold metallo-hydrolase [Thermoanaerobaculia bacterium]|jgi:ribonuclease BN (tRNA processing enzyme)